MFGGGFQFSGVTFFTPPVAIPGADNGLSFDVNTGRFVLGNDIGDALQPGRLLADREIRVDDNIITFPSLTQSTTTSLIPGLFLIQSNIGFLSMNALGNAFSVNHSDPLSNPGGFTLNNQSIPGGCEGALKFINNEILIAISADSEQYRFLPGNIFIVGLTGSNGAKLQVDGDVTTADPGAGQGKWKLGKVQPGVSVVDATQFVQVEIDGLIVKLAMII